MHLAPFVKRLDRWDRRLAPKDTEPLMRHLRITVALVAALVGLLGISQTPASAGGDHRTLLLATQDVSGNSWDGIYYQRYEIDVARNGSFTGTGVYVGFEATRTGANDGAGVQCGLTQKITGKVGAKASFTAQYDAPESAYWYSFKGSIEGTKVSGTGRNVNGQVFKIWSVSEAQLEQAETTCRPAVV